jgi:hypothetical protein
MIENARARAWLGVGRYAGPLGLIYWLNHQGDPAAKAQLQAMTAKNPALAARYPIP